MTPGDEIADAIDPFPTDSDGDQFPDSPSASVCWPSLEDAGSGVLDVQVIIGRSNGQKEEVFLLDAYSYEPVRHSAELPTLLGVTPKQFHNTSFLLIELHNCCGFPLRLRENGYHCAAGQVISEVPALVQCG